MRLIDVDNLTDDCKRYLATLNPDRDGKECTRIRWLIGVLDNAPSVNPDTQTDCISRRATIEAVHENYDKILDFKSDGKTIASSVEDIICDLPSVTPEIIQCKDCKHYVYSDVVRKRVCIARYGKYFTDDNSFCSEAERKG